MTEPESELMWWLINFGPLAGAFIAGLLIGQALGFSRGLITGMKLSKGNESNH